MESTSFQFEIRNQTDVISGLLTVSGPLRPLFSSQ